MSHEAIHVINRQKYDIENPVQTGRSLKELAGIPLTDVHFLQAPGQDEVIANHAEVTLKNGAQLHSQPPATYGDGAAGGDQPVRLVQPDGWTFLVFAECRLPEAFKSGTVRLLVKLPPGFPDASPDMFWVQPAVTLASSGASPHGTSIETVLEQSWQRFSWHLEPGGWRPGVSDLGDFMRCIRARFERCD